MVHKCLWKFTSDYRRNKSHKRELCSQLMFRSSRCIPKADSMGIMQAALITLLNCESFCVHLSKSKLKAFLETDANTVCLMHTFQHNLLLRSFASGFKLVLFRSDRSAYKPGWLQPGIRWANFQEST